MTEHKTCEICGKEFDTNRGAKTCSPECRIERRKIVCKKYNQEHREWYNTYHKKYFQEKLKDKRREQYKDPNSAYRKYMDKHREKINEARRQHYAENKEKIREYHRNYKANHKDAVKEYGQRYREKHRAKLNAKMRERTFNARICALPQTVVEIDGKQIVLYECERLRIKGAHLPCGDRWECWFKGKCEFVPRGKKEITFEDATNRPFNPAF